MSGHSGWHALSDSEGRGYRSRCLWGVPRVEYNPWHPNPGRSILLHSCVTPGASTPFAVAQGVPPRTILPESNDSRTGPEPRLAEDRPCGVASQVVGEPGGAGVRPLASDGDERIVDGTGQILRHVVNDADLACSPAAFVGGVLATKPASASPRATYRSTAVTSLPSSARPSTFSKPPPCLSGPAVPALPGRHSFRGDGQPFDRVARHVRQLLYRELPVLRQDDDEAVGQKRPALCNEILLLQIICPFLVGGEKQVGVGTVLDLSGECAGRVGLAFDGNAGSGAKVRRDRFDRVSRAGGG